MPNPYRTADGAATGGLPDADAIGEIRGMVAHIVHSHRELGIRRATSVAAELLCIGVRRARGYYHHEIRAVPGGELRQCREAYLGYLRQQQNAAALEQAAMADEIERLNARLGRALAMVDGHLHRRCA